MKKNIYIYILLTVLCLITIFLLQTPHSQPLLPENNSPQISKERITEAASHKSFVILTLLYLALFSIGLANIVLFGIRKFQKSPLIATQTQPKKFPLSSEQASKIFFTIIFFSTLLFLSGKALYKYRGDINPVSLVILLNLILEVAVIVILLKFIPAWHLGLSLKGIQLFPLLKIYTALLPIIIGALVLNNFFLEKIGTKPFLNPILKIFLTLDNPTLFTLLGLQIIIFAPLSEELFFRGFLYKKLRNRYSFKVSAIIVSLLFACLHRIPLNILPLFIISFALCYLYEKTQNLFTPIIFHFLHNSLNFFSLLVLKNLLS